MTYLHITSRKKKRAAGKSLFIVLRFSNCLAAYTLQFETKKTTEI